MISLANNSSVAGGAKSLKKIVNVVIPILTRFFSCSMSCDGVPLIPGDQGHPVTAHRAAEESRQDGYHDVHDFLQRLRTACDAGIIRQRNHARVQVGESVANQISDAERA